MVKRWHHYWAWYRQLTSRGYGRIISLEYAWYNHTRYNLDGSYLK